jgi:hypothetical protein
VSVAQSKRSPVILYQNFILASQNLLQSLI